jgi:ribosomal protein S18 acetylase RimI-like enzyme
MIRLTVPSDTPSLLALATATGVFKPMEIETLQEVLDDYHTANQALGHRCFTSEADSEIVGFIYYAPAPMTAGTWYVYWIAVRRELQAKGLGGELLSMAEEDIRHCGGRVLFIETSALPHYDATRRFYLKHGYEREAVLREFYAAGDDMVVFRKQLI